MLNSLLGKKIGMTQLADETGKMTPVTAIDIADWVVLQVKTQENDGYSSLQLGLVKKKHKEAIFDELWLKAKKEYFNLVKEVSIDSEDEQKFTVGQAIASDITSVQEGDSVSVSGRSKGLGFQGVVKRWNFGGGPRTHGSNFHRKPGSIGNMTSQGKVIKGKKLPGHHGFRNVTVQGLQVVRIDADNQCLFVKGAVPGKKDTVLFIKKQGI